MAVGFGSMFMNNADVNMCVYNFNDQSTDAFTCLDNSFDDQRTLRDPKNEIQDIKNVITLTKDVPSGNFVVSFIRPLTPSDIKSGKDFTLSKSTNSFIYAFGPMYSGEPSGNY